MKCPRPLCASHAELVSTENGPYATQRRTYQCMHGHRFSTVEAYAPDSATTEGRWLMNALRAIKVRFYA